MKNKKSMIYLVIGVLVGFVVGSPAHQAAGFPLRRLVYFLIAIIAVMFYMWFENTSQARHMSKWESHQSRGKAFFIVSHYVLARGVPIVFIFIAPFTLQVRFSAFAIPVLIFPAFIAFVTIIMLGYQEWSRCQVDSSARLLRKDAERVRGGRTNIAGSEA